jgi:GTP-binding protein LepA
MNVQVQEHHTQPMIDQIDQRHIRNFCIIAHIDHGKSTLADRLLEYTGAISQRDMQAQVLDSMDLERERGITIKLQPVQMTYRASDGEEYQLNLIDTPGHVDFTYEVSRSLAACEGAILVVDATQGIQAQTLANVYLAMEEDLALVPVLNKIDLPSAEPAAVAAQIQRVIGLPADDVIPASAKEGIGTREILEAVVKHVPPPAGDPNAPLRALIFDSKYDSYKGVIAYVRIIDGSVKTGARLRMLGTETTVDALEVGVFHPALTPEGVLQCGQVGYIATGLKAVRDARVGDTVTMADNPATQALPGYRLSKPMVFAGLYPSDSNDFALLRDALEKLHLNDASLSFQPENSVALGPGFRCGFLGLLHMEVVQERLEREYDLNLLITAPSVEYNLTLTNGQELTIDNPAHMPDPSRLEEMREPWMEITVVSPARFIGACMDLVISNRGEFVNMEYLDTGSAATLTEAEAAGESRVLMKYRLPLSEMLVDFYDDLKSRTQGYASLDYAFWQMRPAKLVKLDVLVNGVPVDALSVITNAESAPREGRKLVDRLRELIPRQMFDVPIQAAIGGRVVARETVRAVRKNVLAKCYGGDITRKRKLLEKQAEGKKRMKRLGSVEIPQEAFMAVLKLRD